MIPLGGFNMTPKVKICGITDAAALQAAVRGAADMVGFLHYPASPRHIEIQDAARLRALLPEETQVAAVGVDMPDDLLQQLREHLRPHFFQLHGDESPQRAAHIRQRFGIPVIKAVRVRTSENIALAEAYHAAVDMLLFDAHSDNLPGGNGIAFNWSLLPSSCPAAKNPPPVWILSGGLTPENVADAIKQTGAPIVDVSSGVETAPGRKDPQRIEAFLRAAKAVTQGESPP